MNSLRGILRGTISPYRGAIREKMFRDLHAGRGLGLQLQRLLLRGHQLQLGRQLRAYGVWSRKRRRACRGHRAILDSLTGHDRRRSLHRERLLSFRRTAERNLLSEESVEVTRRDWLVLQSTGRLRADTRDGERVDGPLPAALRYLPVGSTQVKATRMPQVGPPVGRSIQ